MSSATISPTSTRVRPGAIVRDTTIVLDEGEPVASACYLVGKTGFMHLGDGAFTPYDSAFPGPSFFEAEAFVQVDPLLDAVSVTEWMVETDQTEDNFDGPDAEQRARRWAAEAAQNPEWGTVRLMSRSVNTQASDWSETP